MMYSKLSCRLLWLFSYLCLHCSETCSTATALPQLASLLLSPSVHQSSSTTSTTSIVATAAAAANIVASTTATLAASTTSIVATTAAANRIASTTATLAASTTTGATTASSGSSTKQNHRPPPLSLADISSFSNFSNNNNNNSSGTSGSISTSSRMQIEMLEKMCLDGTFGKLAKEFPDRLATVHTNIGALLKISLTASGSAPPQQQQQQQQQQPLPSSSCRRRRDSLRSHLDSADDDDEVRDSLLPSRKRKAVGKDGLIRMDSMCDSRRRRCPKQRKRNTTFDTITIKKAIWAEFGDRQVSIAVSIS